MHFILLSVLFFGLIPPGGKLLLDLGITSLEVVLCSVGFRLVLQLPVVFLRSYYRIDSLKLLGILIALGLVGAVLQWSQFYGMEEGLSVSVVAFLLYSQPIWTVFLSRWINQSKIHMTHLVKVLFAVLGVGFVSGFVESSGEFSFLKVWAPLLAGFSLAAWICFTAKARELGAEPFQISFYYDSFTFLAALIAYTFYSDSSWGEFANWMGDGNNFWVALGYSILAGLIPNFLFYSGINKVPPLVAGIILLFEPVISTVIAHFAWDEKLSSYFMVGAVLILMANLPLELLKRTRAS